MEEIKIRPTFIRTKNVRNFEALMDGLDLGEDDSRLGLVYGRAGRGKSRTAQWYAANHGYVYLFVLTVWRTNETEFLRALWPGASHQGSAEAQERLFPCGDGPADR